MPLLNTGDLATLARLWEEAQDVPVAQRAAWAEGHADLQRELKDALKAMIADGEEENSGFLSSLPPIAGLDSSEMVAPLATGQILGIYKLIRELGRGGMGSVWLASRQDGLINRLVALKLPHAWMSGAKLSLRFSREREILASLTHRNIARLYDAGVTNDGRPYLALEYIEGRALLDYCNDLSLGVKQRLELFLQVLAAVDYAHQHRVVHRDLKPSNMMVSYDGYVHLLDFGIAKLLEDGAGNAHDTQLGIPALTPSYASPEQIEGKDVGTASDVYSLGVVLYELLTGRRPYRVDRPTRAAMEEAILRAEIEPPSVAARQCRQPERWGTSAKGLSASLRGDLDTIVLTALQKSRSRRYIGVAPFSDDIRRYLAGQTVLARRDGTWYRFAKYVQRNRVVTVSAVLVTMSLSIGLAVAIDQAKEATQQARLALEGKRTAEAAMSFMDGIFRANATGKADQVAARNTTARELLDIGAKRIDSSLADAPAVKLTLYRTLGDMYKQLALGDDVTRIQRSRIALARSQPDPGHRELIDALLDFSESTLGTADTNAEEEGRRAVEEATNRLRANDSQEKEDVLRLARAECLLALAVSARDVSKALVHSANAQELLKQYPSSEEYVNSLHGMATFQLLLRNYQQVETTLGEKEFVESPNPIHRILGNQLHCVALSHLGNPLGAESACRKAFSGATRLLGAGNLMTEHSAYFLGEFLVMMGMFDEAESLLVEEADVVIKVGRLSPMRDVASLYTLLAKADADRGRYDSAQAWLDKYAAQVAAGNEPQQGLQKWLRPVQLQLLIARARYTEAQALLEASRQLMMPGHKEAQALRLGSALLAIREGNVDRAAVILEALNHVEGDKLSPLSPDVLTQDILTAELRLAQDRPKDAKVIASSVLKRIETSVRPTWFRSWMREAEILGGRAELATDRGEDALRHFQRAVTLGEQFLDRRSTLHGDALAWLGIAYAESGRRAQAQALVNQANSIFANRKGDANTMRDRLAALVRRRLVATGQ
ncbi:MAG: protein kinase [Burkholderiales bacterium]|nr:protein kinase [Burkholderiales bacterium]